MKKQQFLLTVLFLGIITLVQGQRNLLYNDEEDNTRLRLELTLKDGVILSGKLVGINVGEYYYILADFGDTLMVPVKEIRHVRYPERESVEEAGKSKTKVMEPYQFRESGFYHASTVGIVFTTVSESGRGRLGADLSLVFGYQKNRTLGFGAGTGVDFYQPGSDEVLMPIFGEVRGYFLPQNVTPYYVVRAGYGVAFKNRELGIWNADGGWMFNPAMGYRFGGRKGMNLTLDVGMKFQKAEFERREGASSSEIDLIYRRMNVRIGLLF